nr:hypothetical protein [Tanacetum cinerariifolium]
CSSCGALYTLDYCCSDGSLGDKIICDLDKTPDLSQIPPQNCPKCGNPVDGHYCQGCALLRKKFKEDLFTYCIENGILQDSSEPSNDNTNVFLMLFKSYSLSNKTPVNLPHKVLHKSTTIVAMSVEEDKQIKEEQAAKTRYWKILACYDDDDDDDYTIAVTPSLSTEEPDNSLSMGDEHLDTIPAMESDEFIKSSVESLVPILSESEGIPEKMCDMPFHDNSSPLDILKDQFEGFFDSNNDSTSIDDDSFSIDNIEYVEASPLDSELISLEVMEIVIPEVGGIDDDILLTIKDDILPVRQAQLVDTDTESDPHKAPSEVEELQSLGSRVPLKGKEFEAFEPTCTRTHSSHSLASSDSTAPLSLDHPSPMSPGLLATVTEAMALSNSTFCMRYRSSYETPSPSLPISVQKRYKDDEDHGLEGEGLGLKEEEQGADRVSAFRQPTLTTWVDPKDGRVYTDIPVYVPPAAPVQTPPSPEWSFGAQVELHGSILYDHTEHLDALLPTLFADIDKDVRELYTRSGVVKEEIFSQRHGQGAALQRELQDMRGRVTVLEQEKDCREQ